MDRIVLVIGNGFDLDLGLDTKYKSFLDSDYFPKFQSNVKKGLLWDIKNTANNEKNWIDLEFEIKKYCTRITKDYERIIGGIDGETLDILKQDFDKLTNGLFDFIKNTNYFNHKKESTAYKLISIFATKQKRPSVKIFNFNYTPLAELINCINEDSDLEYSITHAHGSTLNHDIILGIEDDVEIDDRMCFTIKSHNFNYKSLNIRQELSDAKEVIFFGHSLGSSDYHYFRDFFNDQVSSSISKVITIFTFNEESKQNILIQLRNMNNKKTNYLFGNNDLKIFCTGDDRDKPKIHKYLLKLDEKINPLKYKSLSELIEY